MDIRETIRKARILKEEIEKSEGNFIPTRKQKLEWILEIKPVVDDPMCPLWNWVDLPTTVH